MMLLLLGVPSKSAARSLFQSQIEIKGSQIEGNGKNKQQSQKQY